MSYTLDNDTFTKLFGKKEEDERHKDNKGREENEDRETEEETEEQNNNSNMRKTGESFCRFRRLPGFQIALECQL